MSTEDENGSERPGESSWADEAQRQIDAMPAMIDDSMAELAAAFKAPVAGITFPKEVWGAVWADVGDERLQHLLEHDRDTLFGLLQKRLRQHLEHQEHGA